MARGQKLEKDGAPKAAYVSSNQLELVGFASPFATHLDPGNRVNRKKLKAADITLVSQPLGRPSLAVEYPIRPGDCNPIGQVWAGQERIWYEPHKSKASQNKWIMDRPDRIGAQPDQIDREGISLPESYAAKAAPSAKSYS